MQLTDDRMVEAMRAFVTASNRLDNLAARDTPDVHLLEQVQEQRHLAGVALQEALVARGWRRPSY